MVALDEALSALENVDERKAKTAEIFFFFGHTQDEIATMLKVHVNAVRRDLRVVRGWLQRHLAEVT